MFEHGFPRPTVYIPHNMLCGLSTLYAAIWTISMNSLSTLLISCLLKDIKIKVVLQK